MAKWNIEPLHKICDEEASPHPTYADRMDKIHILFGYAHLPENLQEVSRTFHDLACELVEILPDSPETTLAIRKVWEAKNLAVFTAATTKET